MRIHTGETPYECSECGKKFIRSDCLQVHMTMHTGERPYECSECGKKFTRSSDLRVHMRIHTGERPYQCSKCGKKFIRSGGLQVHMRIHTGERRRPYECSECGKKFTRSDHLQVHIGIHEREKSYQCSECGKKFTLLGSLNIHLRSHRKENLKKYYCEHCGEGFNFAAGVRRHQKVHTREDEIAQKHKDSISSASNSQSNSTSTHLSAQTCASKVFLISLLNSFVILLLVFSDRNLFTYLTIPAISVCSSSLFLSNFHHPNIAVTYGVTVSTCGDGDTLVMERIVTSLSDLLSDLKANDEMNVLERVNISYGLVSAVDYLHHQLGIVHGNICLDNVFVTDRQAAKLLDPAVSCLLHNKTWQRSESYEDDLQQLICLLIKLFDSYSQFSSVCGHLFNMISCDEINESRKKIVSTMDLLELIDGLRQNEEYSCCSRRRQLSWKSEIIKIE